MKLNTLFYESVLMVIQSLSYEDAVSILSAELNLDRERLDRVFDQDNISDEFLARVVVEASHVGTVGEATFVYNHPANF